MRQSAEPAAPPRFAGQATDRPDRAELLCAPLHWIDGSLAARGLELLPGVGPKLKAKAAESGIETIGDLLWRLPRAYGSAPGTSLLAELGLGEQAGVEIQVLRSRRVRTRRRGFSVVEARIADDSGTRKAVWFNQPWMSEQLVPESRWRLEGRLEKGGFVVAAAEQLRGEAAGAASGTAIEWQSKGATPPGLSGEQFRAAHSSGGEIGPGRWRRWSFEACRRAVSLPEPFAPKLLRSRGLPSLSSSFREAHFPVTPERAGLAIRRLAYQELLQGQAAILNRRLRDQDQAPPALALNAGSDLAGKWLGGLPFRTTGDQAQAIGQIATELAGTTPMRRLLMGEVGSGKTVVAIAAMLEAVGSGAQAALMAPTGVLAVQHHATLEMLLEGTGVAVGLLTGSTTASRRQQILAGLEDGDIDIVVGTHALLEEQVRFSRLGLVVIDEEHRFGVRQRAGLESRAPAGHTAHVLHMSATPIPRTLALTAYGDLEVTTLRELPAGRAPVETEVVSEAARPAAFEQLKGALDRGRQGFVVCPLVEESSSVEGRAAEAEAERLASGELSGYEVGLIHGQMKAEQKEVAMSAFADGRIDVLVATSVIEVGVDVPNASVMIIEGAERFGLSQLHQLRGRIGRGPGGGHCFLFGGAGTASARRLAALASTSDGFRLAELDLEMRGEGEITGTRQHGLPRFHAASLPRDLEILELAREDALSMDKSDLDRLAALDNHRRGMAQCG